jgi:hypothetical protein
MQLTPMTVVVRSQNVMSSPVDDEMVMMHLESNQYLGLNPMGRRIWELIKAPIAVQDVCQQLLAEFDVTPEVCEQEVLAFLTDLNESQVVELSTSRDD